MLINYTQVCKFKVGSFNYLMSRMTFLAEVLNTSLIMTSFAMIIMTILTFFIRSFPYDVVSDSVHKAGPLC